MIPFRLSLIICAITLTHWCTCSQYAQAGELVSHTIVSERLAGNLVGESTTKQFEVLLPDGYAEGTQDYPVVYWFPGANRPSRFDLDIDLLDEEFNSGRSVPSIVVFMPIRSSFSSSIYWSSEVFGDWEGFLTDEVIPFVDQNYRTTERRGASGFSLGGFTATTLPILTPGTFQAVGGNDPSIPLVSALPRAREEFPPDYVPGSAPPLTFEEWFARFPDSIDEFTRETPVVHSGYAQIAARIAPDPEHPLGGQIPITREPDWIPDVRQTWRDYDLLDPNSVELHRDALEQLESITLIIPEQLRDTNSVWIREMVRVFDEAGLPAQGFESPGHHGNLHQDRFNMLLANISHTLHENTPLTIGDGSYTEDFDSLGPDLEGSELLPAGWSISDRNAIVQRDRTNTEFGDEAAAFGPRAVNAGRVGESDRAVAVAVDEATDGSTIQLLAEVESGQPVNAYRVKFDALAWAASDDEVESSFVFSAAVDTGGGFESAVDLVEFDFSGSETESPDTRARGVRQFVTEKSHQTTFLGVPDGDTRTLRLRWSADFEDANALTLGIDDVVLTPLFLGDFNNDLELTLSDFNILNSAIRGGLNSEQFDLTGDGNIDNDDLTSWVTGLFGSLAGDTNLDGRVDVADFLAFSRGFQEPVTDWMSGDFDGDQQTTVRDFLTLSRNFGQTSSSSIAVVPEPSTGCTLLTGMAVCLLVRKRRCRA